MKGLRQEIYVMVLWNQKISQTRGKLKYRTIIRPVVTYSAKTWCLLKNGDSRISVWERKILRRIFGPKFDNGEWTARNNKEIYDLYAKPQIIGKIKSSRLRWLGHIERSEDRSLIKRIYRGKPGGKRSVGRPRKKWMEDVEEDIKVMGIRCWRRRAQDREEWIPIVRQALALEGP